MGVQVHETEYNSTIGPAKLFKALVLDVDNLIPKVAPQAIKQVEILEGNGGTGTIKKITFGEGSNYRYMKHRVDAVDEAKFFYAYSLIEGDMLTEKIEKVEYETKLEATAEGSVIKSVSKYYTKGELAITEDHINEGKEKAMGLFKLIEAYLINHPDEY